jgi:hypothetical protein
MILSMATLIVNISPISHIQYTSQENVADRNLIDNHQITKSTRTVSSIDDSGTKEIEQDNNNTASENRQSSDPRDSAVITMQRHETVNGLSPVYSLTIYGNGTVVYKGIKNVDTIGIQTYQIPKDKARELVNEFINIYYFALKDKYSNSSIGSNLNMVTTSINMNGRTKTIVDDHSSYAPPTLRALEDKIDQVTNSKQWIELQ